VDEDHALVDLTDPGLGQADGEKLMLDGRRVGQHRFDRLGVSVGLLERGAFRGFEENQQLFPVDCWGEFRGEVVEEIEGQGEHRHGHQ